MKDRIAGVLFVACLWVAPISTLLYATGLAEWLMYLAIGSILLILGFVGYAFVTAYRELIKSPENSDNPNTTSPKRERKWHLLTVRLMGGLVLVGVVSAIVGFFGHSFIPFMVAFASLIAGIVLAVLSAGGMFERMDNKRNKKLYPEPKRVPPAPLPKIPVVPPHERPGYQYSFDF